MRPRADKFTHLKTDARHGLWHIHRMYRLYRGKDFQLQWWLDTVETYDLCMRAWRSRWIYGQEIGYCTKIQICISRYNRRYPGVIQTVGDYNELVRLIVKRSGWDHYTTLKAALLDGASQHSRITWSFYGDSFECVHSRFYSCSVRKRAENIARIRSERERLETEKHNNKIWRQVWAVEDDLKAIRKSVREAKESLKQRGHLEDKRNQEHAL